MQNLNSILIEGTVCEKPYFVKEGKVTRCSFMLSSLRYVRDGKCVKERKIRVRIMIRSTALVEAAKTNAYDGRGLRAVGWLACDEEDKSVYIEAEHVEYRPEPGSKKKKG
jgi:hypothetical protein